LPLAACSSTGGSAPAVEDRAVDQTTQLLALMIALATLAIAIVIIRDRQRRDRDEAAQESPYATSTEGEKRCPKCGMGNLWTVRNCISCGSLLPG
jgi:hypothetical protein